MDEIVVYERGKCRVQLYIRRSISSSVSYKTDYEQRHVNDIGVHFQNDLTDPWNGKLDNEWVDTVNYKTHFTKQQPIKAWRKDQFVTDKVKRWKVDLFRV